VFLMLLASKHVGLNVLILWPVP